MVLKSGPPRMPTKLVTPLKQEETPRMTSPLSQDTTTSGTEGIIKRPIVEYTASPHELTPGAGSFSESKVQYFPSKE